jgi:hypothetical protein
VNKRALKVTREVASIGRAAAPSRQSPSSASIDSINKYAAVSNRDAAQQVQRYGHRPQPLEELQTFLRQTSGVDLGNLELSN